MFELYFDDLTPEAQKRFLDFYNITAEEGNFDIYPIAVFEPLMEDD